MRAKPLSGKLFVTVKGARELDHPPIVSSGRLRSSSKQIVETYVSLKIEGTQRARSHPSRTDRWNEDFEITVDKANEVEIAVYDKQVSEPHPVPIGFLWIRISDLVESLRRQKVTMDNGQGGWVTAGAMDGDSLVGKPHPQPGTFGDVNAPLNLGVGATGQPGGSMGLTSQNEGIDAWFAVEPAGALALHMNFGSYNVLAVLHNFVDDVTVKENVRKRPLDAPGGLGRQGALRKRKGEVHEMNGHKFVQRQFYQIMLCAFCGDFLLNALGYQCEDCRYTCHKKCYEKVVTKCISKSNTGVCNPFGCSLFADLSLSFSRYRMTMERRSTIESLIASNLSPIWAPIGVAIVVTFFLLVGRTLAGAPSVRSPATPTVRTSFPTSVACPWRPPINYFVTGAISTEHGGAEPLLQDRSRKSIPPRHRHRHFRLSMFPLLMVWTGYTLREHQMFHLQHHRRSPTVGVRLLRMGLIFGIINSLHRVFHLGHLLEQEYQFLPLTRTSHYCLR